MLWVPAVQRSFPLLHCQQLELKPLPTELYQLFLQSLDLFPCAFEIMLICLGSLDLKEIFLPSCEQRTALPPENQHLIASMSLLSYNCTTTVKLLCNIKNYSDGSAHREAFILTLYNPLPRKKKCWEEKEGWKTISFLNSGAKCALSAQWSLKDALNHWRDIPLEHNTTGRCFEWDTDHGKQRFHNSSCQGTKYAM